MAVLLPNFMTNVIISGPTIHGCQQPQKQRWWGWKIVSLGQRKEALWPSTTPAHRRSTAMSTTTRAEGSVRRSWIRRATADELDVVILLVEETADWL